MSLLAKVIKYPSLCTKMTEEKKFKWVLLQQYKNPGGFSASRPNKYT